MRRPPPPHDVVVQSGDKRVVISSEGDLNAALDYLRSEHEQAKKKVTREFLASVDFGHEFGRDRRCLCGLTLLEFRMNQRGEQKLCPSITPENEKKILRDYYGDRRPKTD